MEATNGLNKKKQNSHISQEKMRMNDNADLYKNNNTIPRRDAMNFLNQYKKKLDFKEYARVMDIGSGDGSVTSIIKKYLPNNYEVVVGCDINEKMVEYAEKHHGDERTIFRTLDIEGAIPGHMKCSFDHVVSFFTLQWIRKQPLAFTNIYDILNEGGSCLLLLVANSPTYGVYQALAKTRKWKPYLEKVDDFSSPYHDVQEPDQQIQELMSAIGFIDIDVKCKQMVYFYNNVQSYRGTVESINPIQFPTDEIYEDFIDDHMQMSREMRVITEDTDGNTEVKMKYNLMVIFARK